MKIKKDWNALEKALKEATKNGPIECTWSMATRKIVDIKIESGLLSRLRGAVRVVFKSKVRLEYLVTATEKKGKHDPTK